MKANIGFKLTQPRHMEEDKRSRFGVRKIDFAGTHLRPLFYQQMSMLIQELYYEAYGKVCTERVLLGKLFTLRSPLRSAKSKSSAMSLP